MRVLKRTGVYEDVAFDKITKRLRSLSKGLPSVRPDVVAQKICVSIHDGISTSKLDELASEVAIGMCTEHYDYGTLAARIVVSDLHKRTSDDVVTPFQIMYDHRHNDLHVPLIDGDILRIVKAHEDKLSRLVDFQEDYGYDYFGIRTLMKSYLTRVDGVIVERPQIMLLRVAIGIWADNMERVEATYKLLSQRLYTHATPTLFNAGTPRPQLSSCE